MINQAKTRNDNIWDKELTNKTVVKLNNVGHYPHEEATEEFIEELKSQATNLHLLKPGFGNEKLCGGMPLLENFLKTVKHSERQIA